MPLCRARNHLVREVGSDDFFDDGVSQASLPSKWKYSAPLVKPVEARIVYRPLWNPDL